MLNKNDLDPIACCWLTEAVVADAAKIARYPLNRENTFDKKMKVKEFGERTPNYLLECYCDVYGVDEKKLRKILCQLKLS